MNRKLTKSQESALARAKNDDYGTVYIRPDVAKQLVKRGLVKLTGRTRQRKEYNEPVKGSTLWQIRIINES